VKIKVPMNSLTPAALEMIVSAAFFISVR
jgi:hypothetical protein